MQENERKKEKPNRIPNLYAFCRPFSFLKFRGFFSRYSMIRNYNEFGGAEKLPKIHDERTNKSILAKAHDLLK